MRKYIPSESVDLVYLDPPFNSNESYNVLFKSRDKQPNSQITAFEDTWHWNQTSEDAYDEIMQSDNAKAASAIEGLRQVLEESNMMAYIVMMTTRLIELHRILKPTGSLYLHCDPTASHYLKLIMDSIFSPKNFRNEIIWRRTNSTKEQTKSFGKQHDVIFWYSKTSKYCYNKVSTAIVDEQPGIAFRYNDGDNRGPYQTIALSNTTESGGFSKMKVWKWRGVSARWIYSKDTLEKWWDEGRIIKTRSGYRKKDYWSDKLTRGNVVTDIWTDKEVAPIQSEEKLGWATQKPISLLDRIIKASSNEGNVVLDPFCGCGTAVHAAEKMQRRWIGIDITHLAINIMEDRMKSAFPGIKFGVDGLPQSMDDARKLFKLDPFQFELWAIQRIIPGMQVTSKTGDQGIDGVGRAPVGKDANGRTKYAKIIASVKGGKNIPPSYMNELQGNLAKHNADMGVLLTLEDLPKRSEIVKICAKAGKYVIDSATGPVNYPILQTFKIEDVFEGRRPDLPSLMQSAAVAAPAMKRTRGKQATLTD